MRNISVEVKNSANHEKSIIVISRFYDRKVVKITITFKFLDDDFLLQTFTSWVT
jgi:hypothetical protein